MMSNFDIYHNLSGKYSIAGKEEAVIAAKAIKDAGLRFDVAHTSLLTRAQTTLNTILAETNQTDIQIQKTWHLNERHYGGLTGLNKAETATKYGEQQVQIWRRSFDIPPPPIEPSNPYYNKILNDPRYADGPAPDEFPMFESLKLTMLRTLPYWNNVIVPQLKAGKRVIIVAHGTSLRGLVKHIEGLSDEAITTLNLPTGIPFVYELDENVRSIGPKRFLADKETVRKAIEGIVAQGKAK